MPLLLEPEVRTRSVVTVPGYRRPEVFFTLTNQPKSILVLGDIRRSFREWKLGQEALGRTVNDLDCIVFQNPDDALGLDVPGVVLFDDTMWKCFCPSARCLLRNRMPGWAKADYGIRVGHCGTEKLVHNCATQLMHWFGGFDRRMQNRIFPWGDPVVK